jgi:hypothetical protein
VTDTDVWACYYTDWPVVRIRDGAVTSWPSTVAGARALAVHDDRVALYGGYGPDQDRLVTGELTADGSGHGEYRVVLPEGQPIPARTQVIGQGACLHFITADSCYQLTFPDIPGIPGAAGPSESGRK